MQIKIIVFLFMANISAFCNAEGVLEQINKAKSFKVINDKVVHLTFEDGILIFELSQWYCGNVSEVDNDGRIINYAGKSENGNGHDIAISRAFFVAAGTNKGTLIDSVRQAMKITDDEELSSLDKKYSGLMI